MWNDVDHNEEMRHHCEQPTITKFEIEAMMMKTMTMKMGVTWGG